MPILTMRSLQLGAKKQRLSTGLIQYPGMNSTGLTQSSKINLKNGATMSDEEWVELMSWLLMTLLCIVVMKALLGM